MSEFAALPDLDSAETEGADVWTVHQGDARAVHDLLAEAATAANSDGGPFLQTTITSPPYGTLVDYGAEGQIGHGQTHREYLDSCRSIFGEIYDWTRDTGSLWVVADTVLEKYRRGSVSKLVPLPFQLAAEAESVGWTLREVIIWRKDRTRPWSHRGKLRNGFEYVLFFVKTNNFIFNVDRLRDTGSLKSWWVKYPERHNPWGMAPDNVWEIPIPVQGSWDNLAVRHACPFPPELVRRMVMLSSERDDVVFDPFAGTGSVVAGARREGRRGLGLELNPAYVSVFRAGSTCGAKSDPEIDQVSVMTQRLIELRMLKYPKELAKQLLRSGMTSANIRTVLMQVESVNYKPARTGYGVITCSVVIADECTELEHARLTKTVTEIVNIPPLSKFGLEVEVNVLTVNQSASIFAKLQSVSIYTKGHTWFADDSIRGTEFLGWLKELGTPKIVPVVSPLYVRQSLEESG
ncbi:hypothetical protein CH263_01685 [Rhodococcus sp. 06-1059B-a]|nr:site-specific DNA-methyltransferase [Rhodococcus sp. 06-1059B-a]OZD73774.1 hypothetical protein CH263_01685 [Rhodococcus sp. 06-1059B-a]